VDRIWRIYEGGGWEVMLGRLFIYELDCIWIGYHVVFMSIGLIFNGFYQSLFANYFPLYIF
jgi:hypothetical protein